MNFPLNYLKVLNFSPKKHLAFFTLLLCFFIRCIFGRMHFCLPCVLAFLIFLFVFLCILRRFLVYTFNVLRGAPYAFIKFHLLIKKKTFSKVVVLMDIHSTFSNLELENGCSQFLTLYEPLLCCILSSSITYF